MTLIQKRKSPDGLAVRGFLNRPFALSDGWPRRPTCVAAAAKSPAAEVAASAAKTTTTEMAAAATESATVEVRAPALKLGELKE